MQGQRSETCCFIGRRRAPQEDLERIILGLHHAVESLIAQGVTTFLPGGALGFDQMAASLIIAKKETGKNIRLVFALPYRNQDECWSAEQRRLYRHLLAEAGEVLYISQENARDCMEKHGRFLVDQSGYCICTRLCPFGETERTIRYARQRGVRVLSV
ncbi:MAG: SLOG family protein [Candidatus Limiplasma sp.]|nr:SLOG family protein [Candidatus Limiplasma sp.]